MAQTTPDLSQTKQRHRRGLCGPPLWPTEKREGKYCRISAGTNDVIMRRLWGVNVMETGPMSSPEQVGTAD